jgi:hypothetical protein
MKGFSLMSCKITVLQKQSYTHFTVEGENTKENTLQYLRDIYKECITNNYRYILIEERFEGKFLGAMNVHDIISTASQEGFRFFKAVAFVDVSAESNDLKFIENLAINRSLPVHTFSTVEEAEKWLLSKIAE